MKKNTKGKLRLTRGEKLLYTLGSVCIVLTIFLKVFSSASICDLKIDIEDVSYKIKNQERTNQSYAMQVNELTSYENLNSVLEDMGLAYNNENIIVVK